jgi:hypothetical protein
MQKLRELAVLADSAWTAEPCLYLTPVIAPAWRKVADGPIACAAPSCYPRDSRTVTSGACPCLLSPTRPHAEWRQMMCT